MSVWMPAFCMHNNVLLAMCSLPKQWDGFVRWRNKNGAGLCKCMCIYKAKVDNVWPAMLKTNATPFLSDVRMKNWLSCGNKTQTILDKSTLLVRVVKRNCNKSQSSKTSIVKDPALGP